MQIYHFIYVPGLSDDNVNGQRKVVRMWRWYGVESQLVQMHWSDQEPWEAKFQRLLHCIDTQVTQDKKIVLVGASAGASAVINAYAARKDSITACLLIAGKINHPESIGPRYSAHNPAFVESANACQKALQSLNSSDRRRIVSMYGLIDEVVPRADSYVAGAKNRRSYTIGHAITIGFQLIVGVPRCIRTHTW